MHARISRFPLGQGLFTDLMADGTGGAFITVEDGEDDDAAAAASCQDCESGFFCMPIEVLLMSNELRRLFKRRNGKTASPPRMARGCQLGCKSFPGPIEVL